MKFWQSRYNPQCSISQQDLLDISEEITQAFAPHDIHHQPELVLMPVDPNNLYAYWNLKAIETDNLSNPVDKQLALRIYSIPELSEHPSNIKFSFDINVQGLQNQKKVHLPIAASAYSAVIGEITDDNNFCALAASDTIYVPRENPVTEHSLNDDNNTIQLSPMLENVFLTDHDPHENHVPEHSLNDVKNTVQTSQTVENNFTTKENTENACSEAIIIKNFNDYGYDLKIYKNDSDSQSKTFLSTQNINIQLSSKKTNTIDKNTSGQGRL